jgi:hypothetical protein
MTTIAIPSFNVDARENGDGFRVHVRGPGDEEKDYLVPTGTQQDFSKFFEEVAGDFGTRVPDIYSAAVVRPRPTMRWRPLLTENVHPQILVG